jgi:glycosyltransferase involved in cell wall biosynthesis
VRDGQFLPASEFLKEFRTGWTNGIVTAFTLFARFMNPSLRIAVVVASYKRPDALQTVLTSLSRQTLPPSAFELAIVVDGIDEHQARYRDIFERATRELPFAIRYEFQENAGQSVARHRAIESTSAPWICVIDDDMELLPEFLAAHLALLEAGSSRTVVIGRVIPEDDWERSPLYEAVRTSHMLEWHEDMAKGHKAPTGYTLVTQNVSFSKAFYLAVGGFDPKLRLGEDSELGLRFEFAGGTFLFGAKASAIHRSRVGSYDAWLRRCFEYGRMGVYIHKKLGGDLRAHPLRNLVNGSRLNAAAVHALCWSDPLAKAGIATLHTTGNLLQRVGLMGPAIATHKAILALAFHVGVKDALGSWPALLEAKRRFAVEGEAPHDAT